MNDNTDGILAANQKDLIAANNDSDIDTALISRLTLTPGKINTLCSGLKQIADDSHNILGKVLKATQVAEGLELRQVTVPIGVLLVIFESRPDALPQV